jgi:polar amino acid transport system substrate-binding protein
MPTRRRLTVLPALVAAAVLVSACSAGASPGSTASGGAAGCAPDTLQTKTAGTLTIGTDNPAYPPYFDPPGDGETAPAPWSDGIGDPTNGRGFEGAVAYAVAEQLGYATDAVNWIAVPFDNSYAPGAKEFDFYLAQVSYTDERAQAVDMSDGYYFVNQALVANADTDITSAGSIADLKGYTLGAAQATTAYTLITDTIQPNQDPMVYTTNDDAISALEAGQVDGIVVDLPTAFYITAAQMENGTIVGQFAGAGQPDDEHFSLVLEKDSPLTDCVNQAIGALKDSGTLDDITNEWLSDKADAPVLE